MKWTFSHGLTQNEAAVFLRRYEGEPIALPTLTEPDELLAVYHYDEKEMKWSYFTPLWPEKSLYTLEPGEIYQVVVQDACEWELPVVEPLEIPQYVGSALSIRGPKYSRSFPLGIGYFGSTGLRRVATGIWKLGFKEVLQKRNTDIAALISNPENSAISIFAHGSSGNIGGITAKTARLMMKGRGAYKFIIIDCCKGGSFLPGSVAYELADGFPPSVVALSTGGDSKTWVKGHNALLGVMNEASPGKNIKELFDKWVPIHDAEDNLFFGGDEEVCF